MSLSGSSPWRTLSKRTLCDARIFTVVERECAGPHGKSARFSTVEAPDWAVVIPVLETEGLRRIVMVRQWRHGSAAPSLEFPGGVVDPGEAPAEAAARELREETGYVAGRIRLLGDLSPNPAFMENRFYVYLAEDLESAGERDLDEHEIVDVEVFEEEDALAALGSAPGDAALMSAAAYLYLRDRDRHRVPSA